MEPEPFTIIGNINSAGSKYPWDLEGGGWSPSTSAFKPAGDRSVLDSSSFTREAHNNKKTAENNMEDTVAKSTDEAPWNVTSTGRSVDPADESPLTSLAGAVPKMVDEALERAQSFLKEHVAGGKIETEQTVPGEIQGKAGSGNDNMSSAAVAEANLGQSASPREGGAAHRNAKAEGRVDPQEIAEIVKRAVAGMLDEKLRSREDEQMKLVQKVLEESKSLSERAAQLEVELEEAKQRELDLEKKMVQVNVARESKEEQQSAPDASISLSKSILPSLAAMPEDTRTFKSNSVGSGTPRASKEDSKQSSSRPPAAIRNSTDHHVPSHTAPCCASHGLPLLLWNETTQRASCTSCEEEQKGRYNYSFGGSPRGSARARSVGEACEAKLRMMEGSLREFDNVKAVLLEEEIRRTESKLEELMQMVTTAARDLREDFEQAMELLQSTHRVKEHMLVDHRQQLDEIAKKVAQLHRAHEEGAKACETADHEGMISFLSKHTAVYSQECWQLLARPLPRSVQVPLEDIPFEVNKRRELLRKAQCFEKLTLVKNQVLCDIVEALKEEKANHNDTREYAAEMESLLDAYADEWEKRFNYVCSYCGQQIEPALANELYCELTGGQKGHYWVSADRAISEETKASMRPQLPKLASSSPRGRSNQKISAVSPMFRGDSSVDGSPASRYARKGNDSPRIGVERTDAEILSIVGSLLREKFPQDHSQPFRKHSSRARNGILSRIELWKTIREDLDTFEILTDAEVDRIMLCCDMDKNGVLEIDKFINLFNADEADIR